MPLRSDADRRKPLWRKLSTLWRNLQKITGELTAMLELSNNNNNCEQPSCRGLRGIDYASLPDDSAYTGHDLRY